MFEKMRAVYRGSSLAVKIRMSYILLLIPTCALLFVTVGNMMKANARYDAMIDSAVTASEFSLDFKDDFDYETYLLIVGNKTVEESRLDELLNDAGRVVSDLESLTESEENLQRLDAAKKYLNNLDIYKTRIEQNLVEGNHYEANIEIWENDIQIVTNLLRETIFQYIFYEIRDLQHSRLEIQEFYVGIVRMSVVAFFFLGVLILLLSYFIPQSISKPIRKLSKVTEQVAGGDLNVRVEEMPGAEVHALGESFNQMIDKINTLLDQVTEEQVRLRKAEMELLQAQINPHFLYNTLDTIVWLAEAGEQKRVVHMVGNLSAFFRTSLNQGKDIISVQEELKHVRSYLEIQQIRYQDILEFSIDVPESLSRYRIPKITIQPLVENALYHGIKNKRGLGRITVTGEEQADAICLCIRDNGIGMTPERLAEVRRKISHREEQADDVFGLYNVNERIAIRFGNQYGLSVESTYREGTIVKVTLPKAL